MGVIYLKDKPEADSFKYAYVEAEDGSLVKVSIENIKKALKVYNTFNIDITLTTAGWGISNDGTYYTQGIQLLGATANSRVDLQPTPNQIIQLMYEEVSIFVANDNGNIVAYSLNGIPSEDMTFAAIVTEVT